MRSLLARAAAGLLGASVASAAPAGDAPPALVDSICAAPTGHGDTPECRECLAIGFPVVEVCLDDCRTTSAGDPRKEQRCVRSCAKQLHDSVGDCVEAERARKAKRQR